MIDMDLLCLCPITPLALGAGNGDAGVLGPGGLGPAGTLSESDGLCPELDRPVGNLGLIVPDRNPVGSCNGAPLFFPPPNAFPFVGNPYPPAAGFWRWSCGTPRLAPDIGETFLKVILHSSFSPANTVDDSGNVTKTLMSLILSSSSSCFVYIYI